MSEPKSVEEKWQEFFRSLSVVELKKLAEHGIGVSTMGSPFNRALPPAILDSVIDDNRVRVFNGVPSVTVKWLNEHPEASQFGVLIGKTSVEMTVAEYLSAMKYRDVLSLVQAAMTRQDVSTRNGDQRPADSFAEEITRMIIELF